MIYASRMMNDIFALRANMKEKSGRNARVSSTFKFIHTDQKDWGTKKIF
jgi:hypothetical protein